MQTTLTYTDLAENYNEISRICHETKEPVYITKDGQNDLVVMSNELYEKSNVSGIDALLFEEEMQKIACIEIDGIAYTLSSYGVTDEDFQNLIVSLLNR